MIVGCHTTYVTLNWHLNCSYATICIRMWGTWDVDVCVSSDSSRTRRLPIIIITRYLFIYGFAGCCCLCHEMEYLKWKEKGTWRRLRNSVEVNGTWHVLVLLKFMFFIAQHYYDPKKSIKIVYFFSFYDWNDWRCCTFMIRQFAHLMCWKRRG